MWKVRFFDAHNHLADPYFDSSRAAVLSECTALDLVCVINSTCPSDWPKVSDLVASHPHMIPSYGIHPWFVQESSLDDLRQLPALLLARASAVGEIGLDYSRRGTDRELQIKIFRSQLQIAAELSRAVSIHCVRAWGDLQSVLRECERPRCGFLLHSYSGPIELIAPLASLGAYFSLSESIVTPLGERRAGVERSSAMLKHIPQDRLLLETDAPGRKRGEADFDPLKPSSIVEWYHHVALLLGENPEIVREQINENGKQLFGIKA